MQWNPPLFATLSGKGGALDNAEDVDTLIAQQLNQMSVQEREQVQEEIHGVHRWRKPLSGTSDHSSNSHPPSPHSPHHHLNNAFVDDDQTGELLQRMQTAIDEIQKRAYYQSASGKPNAYSVAMEHGFQYIHSFDFRIKFIRAEQDPACSSTQSQRHVADRAALRFLMYLDLLYKMFGLEALRRPLSLAHDFSEEDLAYMKEGEMQVYPSRDRADRRVASIIVMPGQTYPSTETRIRSYMYCWSVLANDEVSQKLGYVGIVYFHPSMSVLLSQTILENRQVMEQMHASMPIRISALHFIDGTRGEALTATNMAARIFRNALVGTLHQAMRIRCRFHLSGMSMETRYALLSFGIPVHELPVAMPSNTIKTKNHMKWMKMRYHLEQLIWTHDTMQQIRTDSIGQNNRCSTDFGRSETDPDGGSNKGNKKKRKKMTDLSPTDRTPDQIVECPKTTDVLFANGGKAWMKHEGNVQFVQLLEKSIPAYMGHSPPPLSPSSSCKATTNNEYVQGGAVQSDDSQSRPTITRAISSTTSFRTKKIIIKDVIDTVRNNGGRFLSWEDEYGWWVILDQQALDVKVRRALLDHNRRLEDRKKARYTSRPVEEGIGYRSMDGGGGNSDGFLATNRDDEIQCCLTNPSGADPNVSIGPSRGTRGGGCFGCFGTDR